MTRKLVLDDITDLRAYERERPAFREQMLQVRRRRRLCLGPVLTIAFESRDTIRYQIQEMARAERLSTDDDILAELDAYNSLVPEAGHLCATLFLELTTDDELRDWLPALVGIERHLLIRLSDGREIRSAPEAQHARQLTRTHVTSAVHYLTFDLTPDDVEALAAGGVSMESDHPAYIEALAMPPETIEELLLDVRD